MPPRVRRLGWMVLCRSVGNEVDEVRQGVIGPVLAARQASQQGRQGDAAHHAAAVVAFAVQTGAVLYERQAAQFTTAASA